MAAGSLALAHGAAAAAAEVVAPAHCQAGQIILPAAIAGAPLASPAMYEAAADRVELVGEQTINLQGDAQILHGARGIYADAITYNRDTTAAQARGDVILYTAGGDEIRADELELHMDSHTGRGAGVQIKIADRAADAASTSAQNTTAAQLPARARASAESAQILSERRLRLKQVALTNCPPDNEDVVLRAKEININRETGVGVAKALRVYFKQTPIFYFPYLTFPIDDRRKTGFLFPRAGYDEDSGAIIAAPYYFNLAPNYDATLTPRILSKRGAQLGARLRYLNADGGGEARIAWLPSDDQFDERDRYALRYQYAHAFNADWHASLDWQRISDRFYLRDLDSDIESAATSHLPSRAAMNYFGAHMHLHMDAHTYDIARPENTPDDLPLDILPRVNLRVLPQKIGALEFDLTGEYTNFHHSDAARAQGARLRTNAGVSLPLRKPYGELRPRIALHTLDYRLQHNDMGDDDSPAVRVPAYSVDGRLFLDRAMPDASAMHQSLEARLLYLRIPTRRKQNENDFPVFDTGNSSASSFAHLFRENRFIGGDRIGDTEQIAAGITHRIHNANGAQRLRLSLGQIFYLRDREIELREENFPAEKFPTNYQPTPTRTDQSAVVGEMVASLNKRWQVRGFARWGEDKAELDALRWSAEYHKNARRKFGLGYTYEDARVDANATEQIDASWRQPLGAAWQWYGKTSYSTRAHQMQAAEVGVDFNGCCWAVRAAARRYLDGAGAHKKRFMITFELAGLGRLGAR